VLFFPIVVAVLVGLAVVVATIVILVAGRREADPGAQRTLARYLGALCFLALFTTLFATYFAVAALSDLIVDHDRGESEARQMLESNNGDHMQGLPRFRTQVQPASDDRDYRIAVQSGLVAVAAGVIFVLHRRRRDQLAARDEFDRSAAWRVDTTYLYAVCFTAALVIIFAAATGSYGVFRIIAPGVTALHGATTERQHGAAQLIAYAYLALAAAAVFVVHWRATSAMAESADDASRA